MITVLSQQRPGRPKWALPVGLVLLLVTLGMAGGLILAKKRAQHISLGPVAEWPGALRAALPEGWEAIEKTELPDGAVYGLSEPGGGRKRVGRQLYLFRGISETFALPSREGCQTLQLIARGAVPQSFKAELGIQGFDAIGPFAGCTVIVKHLLQTGRGTVAEYYHLGRVAVTPGGQVFGVLIETGYAPRGSDASLLDRLCEQLTVGDEALTDDVSGVMQSAGFGFDAPSDVQAVVPSDARLPGCQITGGEKAHYWCLNIDRVPLVEDRQPGDLLTDYATATLEDPNAPQDIATSAAGDRELLSLALTPVGGRGARGLLWAMRTDARTAVLMRGRCELEGEEQLKKFVDRFAASVVVDSYDDAIDIEAARRRARRMLKGFAEEGLDALWSKYLERAMVYDAYSFGLPLGRESVLYDESEGGDGWLVSKQMRFESWGLQISIAETWAVEDSGALRSRELTRSLRRPDAFKAIVTTDYRELGVPLSQRVDRQLMAHSADRTVRRSVQDHVEVDDVYGCEPVLLEAAARMSTDPRAEPMIFTSTEPYTAKCVYWILTPLGPTPWPGDRTGELVNAVRLQFDYDPDPIMLYFDDEGAMLGHASKSGVYYVLTDNAKEEAMPDEREDRNGR